MISGRDSELRSMSEIRGRHTLRMGVDIVTKKNQVLVRKTHLNYENFYLYLRSHQKLLQKAISIVQKVKKSGENGERQHNPSHSFREFAFDKKRGKISLRGSLRVCVLGAKKGVKFHIVYVRNETMHFRHFGKWRRGKCLNSTFLLEASYHFGVCASNLFSRVCFLF